MVRHRRALFGIAAVIRRRRRLFFSFPFSQLVKTSAAGGIGSSLAAASRAARLAHQAQQIKHAEVNAAAALIIPKRRCAGARRRRAEWNE
jgi:hypothetical protein